MVDEKRKIYTTVVIIALVGLVFSCVVGALAGSAAGFLVGRRQAKVIAERVWEGQAGDLERFYLERPRAWGRQWPFDEAEPEDLPFELPLARPGALVVEVIADTPAEEAGLREGDLIVAIDRTPIDENHSLPDVIAQYEPGDRVTVRLWREDQEQSVRVELTANPEDPERPYLGVYFEMVEGQDLEWPLD